MKKLLVLVALAACGDGGSTPEPVRTIDTDMVIDTANGPLMETNLTIAAGATVRFIGDAPAEIIVDGQFTLAGKIDVSAGCDDGTPRCAGPGGGIGAAPELTLVNNTIADFTAEGCGPGINAHCGGVIDNHRCYGAGGGAGGECATFEPLVGGSGGGRGISAVVGNVTERHMNAGGGGGGALHITATSISVSGVIDAGGAGGAGGAQDASGGGGGAGGTVFFQASHVVVTATAIIAANGGSGGSANGANGADGAVGTEPSMDGAQATSTVTQGIGPVEGGKRGGPGLIGIRAQTTQLDGVISPAPVLE